MGRLKIMRSAFLAIALLWQCLAPFFAPSVEAAETLGAPILTSTAVDDIQKFALLRSAIPALIEIKKEEISAKKLPQDSSDELSNQLKNSSFRQHDKKFHLSCQYKEFVPPVKRGYWLLYRSLLL